jgi:hypothetical protein
MSSAPGTGSETASLVAEFCAARYGASGAAEFGIDRETFTGMVAVVVERWNAAPLPSELSQFLGALRVDELVLTRACAAGHDVAWEKFLNRYRATLYSAAYKIAHDVLGYARYRTPIHRRSLHVRVRHTPRVRIDRPFGRERSARDHQRSSVTSCQPQIRSQQKPQ